MVGGGGGSGSTRGSGALVPSPVLDIARFDALVAQVDQLTKLLAEQTVLNLKLQQQLSDALAQQTNLNLQLRTLKTRSRSADATAGSSYTGDDTRMSSSEGEHEPQVKLRRSPPRAASPSNE